MRPFRRTIALWTLLFLLVPSSAWASPNKCSRWYLQFGMRTMLAVPVVTLFTVWGVQRFMGHLEAEKRKALVAAANARDSKKMLALINEGARVYRDDRHFYQVASGNDHFELAQTLLQKEVDPAYEQYGYPLLKWAIDTNILYTKRMELIEQILNATPDVASNPEYKELLEIEVAKAVGFKDFALVKLLLEKGASLPDSSELRHFVEAAAAAGNLEQVKYLIAHGADPDAALRGAGEAGNLSIIQWLIDSGIKFNGEIPYKDLKAMDLVIKNKQIFTGWFNSSVEIALARASTDGTVEALETLWSHAKPETRGNGTELYLENAIKNGNKPAIKFWLDKGIDPVESGALVAAIKSGQWETLKYLIEDRKLDARKESAIGHVVKHVYYNPAEAKKQIEYLLSKNADINAQGSEALIYAKRYRSPDIEKALRDHGAVETPEFKLFFAADEGNASAVEKLLADGANPDFHAETMLEIAGDHNRPDIAALLLSKTKLKYLTPLPRSIRERIGENDPKWAPVEKFYSREYAERYNQEGVPTWLLPLSNEERITELEKERKIRPHFSHLAQNVLNFASKEGNIELIEMMLDKEFIRNHELSSLNIIAEAPDSPNHRKVTDWLLGLERIKQADLNIILARAAASGKAPFLKTLIAKGADPNSLQGDYAIRAAAEALLERGEREAFDHLIKTVNSVSSGCLNDIVLVGRTDFYDELKLVIEAAGPKVSDEAIATALQSVQKKLRETQNTSRYQPAIDYLQKVILDRKAAQKTQK